jgi:ABC-type branched-subunit amino acid transport system ATPase component
MRDEFAGNLSGGQRKLLEMARRTDGRPRLIMLDEPMAGVNPALTQSLLGHVKSLRDEGRTVIFVEHDMDVVRDISDWVVVMAEGSIIARGRRCRSRQPAGHRRLPRCAPRHGPGGRAMAESVIEAVELVAGYVPEVNILNGCT